MAQYQKPNPASDPYSLDIHLFDANENEIGSSGGKKSDAEAFTVASNLLVHESVVNTKSVNLDPMLFVYADQHWGSNDQPHNCYFGSYDGGKREGDCVFTY